MAVTSRGRKRAPGRAEMAAMMEFEAELAAGRTPDKRELGQAYGTPFSVERVSNVHGLVVLKGRLGNARLEMAISRLAEENPAELRMAAGAESIPVGSIDSGPGTSRRLFDAAE